MRKILGVALVLLSVAVPAAAVPCSSHASCSLWAETSCLPTQTGICKQPNTAASYCACFTPLTPSNPTYPAPLTNPQCGDIVVLNRCLDICGDGNPGTWECRNGCYFEWGTCGA